MGNSLDKWLLQVELGQREDRQNRGRAKVGQSRRKQWNLKN